MKRIGVLLVLFACCVVGAFAQAPSNANATTGILVLYDNFNGQQIDPLKWDDWTNSMGMRDVVRKLSPSYEGQGNNGRLHLLQRAYSWTGNDDGASYGWLGLSFTNPASITEVSFSMVVNRAMITGCQTNPSGPGVTAGLNGRFFNYGGQQDPSQDVGADINLARDPSNPTGALRVQADYATQDGTASQYQTLGYAFPGQTVKLRMKWDQPNHQFVFQFNNNPPVAIGYGSLPDTLPPVYPLKVLQIQQGTPHCTTTPVASALMDVYFDNVYVNAH